MSGRFLTVVAVGLVFLGACDAKQEAPRPSGLKNMAPPPIQDSVQEGLDVEPNGTFVQATGVTLTGDSMQWRGSLDPGDVDVWLLKAKAGTIADIAVTPESDYDVVVDYSPTDNESSRHYYDNFVSGQPEVLTNIRLTPQGGYLTVRSRLKDGAGPVMYRISMQRVYGSAAGSVVEAEINDDRTEAMLVNPATQVEGVLFPRGDVDYYRVALRAPSIISFDVPDGAHEVAIEQNDKAVWSQVVRSAQVLKSDILTPDLQEVYVRLKSLEDIREPRHYSFIVNELDKIPDEIEPNDTIEKAQAIQEGQNLEFSLLDDADVDIFRLVPAPGRVYRGRLVGPQAGQARLEVLGADGRVRADVRSSDMAFCDAQAAEPNALLLKVSPGTASWPLNYRISIDSEDAANVEIEPNQLPAEATPIEPGMTLYGHIFPADDVDMYRIRIPEYPLAEGPVGKLNVDIEGGYVAQLQIKLQDGAGYEISQMRNEQYSRPMRLSFDAPNGSYYLSVTGAGDECLKPYALKVTFEPNEQAAGSLTAPVPPLGNGADMPVPSPAVPAHPVDIAIDDLIQAAQSAEKAGAKQPEAGGAPKKFDDDDDAF